MNKHKQKLLSIYKRRSIRTGAEIAFRNLLKKSSLKFIEQKGWILGNGFYISDFYIPRPHKICIEIDGGYHNNPAQIARDFLKDNYLKKDRGFRGVIRFKNEQVFCEPQYIFEKLELIRRCEYSEVFKNEPT